MTKQIAVALLKMLLRFLGSDLNREAERQLTSYNRRKAEVEEELAKSRAEISELEKQQALIETERREIESKRILIESEIEQINRELEKLNHEKADKLRRINDLSDRDVLRADF